MEVSDEMGVWEKIIKNSLDIICTTDKDGYFININEACEAILGYESKEIVGRHFRDFVYPDDLPDTQKITQHIISGYKATSFQNRFIHKKGWEVPIIWSGAWSEEGKVIISVGRDVREQKLAKKKEELHRALIEHGSDMLALLGEDLIFLNNESSASTFRELGYTPEQLVGTNALHLVHPEDFPVVKESLSKVLASDGYIQMSDFRFKNANGEWRWLETTLSNQLQNPAIKALVASSRDITERIHNRLKLQESEQRFKSLFDHHLDIVLHQNRDGLIIDVNTATLAFFGIQKQDILNRPFSDFIPPGIVPICKQTLQDALNGESVKFDITISFPGKGDVNFEIAKIPIIVDGETIGVYSILRDITDITRTTLINRQQALKLNTILESITDAFYTLDRNWTFTYVNSELERLFQTKREQLLGKNLWDLTDESIKQELFNQFSQAVESGKSTHFKTYLGNYDIWLQVKAFPSEDGLSVFLDDISERVKSEQELEKLSLVASKTTNGVIIIGADGLTEWVNDGFEKITGYTFAEVVGKDSCALLQGEDTDKGTVKKIYSKIKEGKGFTEEIIIYKKSGEKVWFLLDITPVLNDKSEVVRFIIIQSDITFRKEAEASQLELTKDLFRQNKDLQQFTYIVSHNLRSPVANAMGLVEILSTSDKESDSFDLPLSYLKTSVTKLDTVLRDLNMILSVRDKKDNVIKEKVQLASVCQQVVGNFRESLETDGSEVNIEVKESDYVRGNKAYVYSIFYNLLSNSIKFRSTQRALRVKIKCLGSTDKGTIISFSDNGSGFDMELAGDKVFQLYKRFHTSSDGRGMGLFLIKTHLDAMGGHIEVSSKVNEGTRFLIYLK